MVCDDYIISSTIPPYFVFCFMIISIIVAWNFILDKSNALAEDELTETYSISSSMLCLKSSRL